MTTVVCVSGKIEGTIAEILTLWGVSEIEAFVGIDRGAHFLLEEGYPLDWAIGDFDSLSKVAFERVKVQAKHLLQAPREKDDTDTELCVKEMKRIYPTSEIVILGGLSGRLDHLWSVLFLPFQGKWGQQCPKLSFLDVKNAYFPLSKGRTLVKEKKGWTFGFACLGNVEALSIQGAKYNLLPTDVKSPYVYACNMFIGQDVECTFTKGNVGLIYSRD